MPDMDRNFLIEVFKESNSHIRATDRKSLVVTGAYISLFSLLLTSLLRRGPDGLQSPSWAEIAVLAFFLLIGSCIFVMQQWYRAWKEHYIRVCFEIRHHVLPKFEPDGVLPYWLRHQMPQSIISIDNLLKHLTAVVNIVLLFLMCYELMNLLQNRNLAFLIVAALFIGYVALIYATDRVIRRNRELLA